ncbi:hypothetical protein PHJA_000990500 [Phtheirospermum japonicum]|uniref:Uncharacterized protein n=1 Tax=Phtheirospermum japonicum TaxID=374723 RepID=A0A830BU51_9LAMI|nr:hypothetical protein PHJA_000990500 [Phtheirospermum japonicum]
MATNLISPKEHSINQFTQRWRRQKNGLYVKSISAPPPNTICHAGVSRLEARL